LEGQFGGEMFVSDLETMKRDAGLRKKSLSDAALMMGMLQTVASQDVLYQCQSARDSTILGLIQRVEWVS
jgi:hypothetical protein